MRALASSPRHGSDQIVTERVLIGIGEERHFEALIASQRDSGSTRACSREISRVSKNKIAGGAAAVK
jgi:hypothetical protein